MSRTLRILAFDLGAESGRAVLGTLAGGRIELEQVHRFPTEGITVLGRRQWDLTRIYGEMIASLKKFAAAYGRALDGIGIDTWGVDFGLLAGDGTVLSNPAHYRSFSAGEAMEAALQRVPREEMYRATGIQFLPFNTIFQLFHLAQSSSPLLDVAESLLMMPDLFAYLLCGLRNCEYTDASTTQMLAPSSRTWNSDLLDKLDLPRRLLLEPTPPGRILGPLLADIAAETGLFPDVPVIAPATHDTASAIAAVPVEASDEPWAYLSSGTWSLMGAELDAPHISGEGFAANFTNEGGVENTIRFLKNINGLWPLQECRREWSREGETLGYAELTREAEAAEPMRSLIDVDDARLLAPESMSETIQALCREGGRPEPETRARVVRCILESLALKYRRTLRELDAILGRTTRRLHIIGGGVQNDLLCQMTADACGVPVVAGPVEATALGNILMQAKALGALDSLAEGRRMIARSVKVERYEPGDSLPWVEAETMLHF